MKGSILFVVCCIISLAWAATVPVVSFSTYTNYPQDSDISGVLNGVSTTWYSTAATEINSNGFYLNNGSSIFGFANQGTSQNTVNLYKWNDDGTFTEKLNVASFQSSASIDLKDAQDMYGGLGIGRIREQFYGFTSNMAQLGFTLNNGSTISGCFANASFSEELMKVALVTCDGKIVVYDISDLSIPSATFSVPGYSLDGNMVLTPTGIFSAISSTNRVYFYFRPYDPVTGFSTEGQIFTNPNNNYFGTTFAVNKLGTFAAAIDMGSTRNNVHLYKYNSVTKTLEQAAIFAPPESEVSFSERCAVDTNGDVYISAIIPSTGSRDMSNIYVIQYNPESNTWAGSDAVAFTDADIYAVRGAGNGHLVVYLGRSAFSSTVYRTMWIKRVVKIAKAPTPTLTGSAGVRAVSVSFTVPQYDVAYDYVSISISTSDPPSIHTTNVSLSSVYSGSAKLDCPPVGSSISVSAVTYFTNGVASDPAVLQLTVPQLTSIESVSFSGQACTSSTQCGGGNCYSNEICNPQSGKLTPGDVSGDITLSADNSQICIEDYEGYTSCTALQVGAKGSAVTFSVGDGGSSLTRTTTSFTVTAIVTQEQARKESCEGGADGGDEKDSSAVSLQITGLVIVSFMLALIC